MLEELYVYVEDYITQTAGSLQQGDDIILRDLLTECIAEQLTQMNSYGDAYRNFDEFKEVLQKRMNALPRTNFDLSKIDLKALDLPKWLRHTPLLERTLNFFWGVVDVGCFGLFFQGWGLWEPAKLAATIGKIPLFQWVKNQSLEKWVVGLVLSAFVLKFVESARKLADDKLTPQGRTQARWNIVTSFAESILYSTIYLNIMGKTRINNVFILSFAIFAKSLGLLSIALRPKREFFQ